MDLESAGGQEGELQERGRLQGPTGSSPDSVGTWGFRREAALKMRGVSRGWWSQCEMWRDSNRQQLGPGLKREVWLVKWMQWVRNGME